MIKRSRVAIGNSILVLMSVALVLLSANLKFAMFSVYLDDVIGQLFVSTVLTVAG
jgi:NADH:ubiquinone oxidoreductase subunit K